MRSGRLDFEAPDPVRYPAIGLGMEAGTKGQTYPTVLNAANEVAVQLFLDRQLTFDRIVLAGGRRPRRPQSSTGRFDRNPG